MSTSLCNEIEALTAMKPPELRARWCEVDRSVAPNIGPDLLRCGNELRIALPPEGSSQDERVADQSLVRLLAQGFAAREHVLTGKAIEPVCSYNRKHLHRLVRLSWLAPDIIALILEGRQPVQLAAHHLMCCAKIPTDWKEQRNFLGFN
jgi:hypothetical protein